MKPTSRQKFPRAGVPRGPDGVRADRSVVSLPVFSCFPLTQTDVASNVAQNIAFGHQLGIKWALEVAVGGADVLRTSVGPPQGPKNVGAYAQALSHCSETPARGW